ncbi:ferredoxin [Mycobacterium sp. CBMA271]|nr:ferredoxin [Mycobacteroides sp. CBMA 271]
MKVSADADMCFGSGLCARMVPEVFGADSEGIVLVRGADPDGFTTVHGRQVAAVKQVSLACPAGAVTVTG